MKKGVLFLLFAVFILIFVNSLFFVYYFNNEDEVRDVSYNTNDLNSDYYEDDILRETYSYNNDVIKLNADKNIVNENPIKKISDKSSRSSKNKRSSGGSGTKASASSDVGQQDNNNNNSAGDNGADIIVPAVTGAAVNDVDNTSIDINNGNNSKDVVINNTDGFSLDNNTIINRRPELNQSEINETLVYPQGPDVGFCQYNLCDSSPATSYESDEGPGGGYCCPVKAAPYGAAGYEECTNYYIKSTAHVKNDDATDFCTDSHTLKEAFLDCDIGNDDLYYKIKDCNDFDLYGDYEYYCTNNKVKKHRRFFDYGCGDGACKQISNNYVNDQVISQLGDSDYCSKRKEGVTNGWAGCTLCGQSDYDCDFDSECSGSLQCKGTLGPSSSDGCCSVNAKWDSSLKICCISHYSYTCYDNDVYYYDSCGVKEDKALECGEDSCGSFGNNYCKNGDVYKKRTCYDKGCSNDECFSHPSIDEQLVQDCDYDCSNGQCIPKPACFSNSDCGTDGYIDEQFCSANQLKRTYRIYSCNNPGTQSAFCSHSDSINTIDECDGESCGYNYYCNDNDVYQTATCDKELGCPSSDTACKTEHTVEDKKYGECGTAGCSNAQCCQTHSSYSCSEGDVYWYSSCSVKEDKKQECGDSGFVGSNYCFDSDVYRNYTTKGCSGNSCTTNTEKQKQNECGSLGCSNGQCNSCQTHSSYACSEGDVYWYNSCNVKEDKKEECGSKSCSNGQCVDVCIDECVPQGETQCNGNTKQTCGNYDSDSCLEWGNNVNCQYGCSNGQCNTCTPHSYSQCSEGDVYWYNSCNVREDKKQECGSNGCSNGQCIPEPCVDECSTSGAKQCSGSNLQTCGNYDSDSCLEWGNNVNCPSGCSNGQCNTQCSEEYPLLCNNLCYRCPQNSPVLFCPTDVNANKFCYSSISSCKNYNSNVSGMCVSKFACYVNADCGVNGYIGAESCSDNDLVQTYRTYICNNANSASANCSFSDISQIKQDCGDSGYTGSNYCFDGDVYRDYVSRGCSNNACFANTQKQKQQECGSLSCSNGVCASEKQMTINLNAGTNLFSIPLIPSGGKVSFGNINNNCVVVNGGVSACSGQNIAYLNPDTKAYVCLNVNSDLHPGQGYFVKVLSSCSLTIRGSDLASNKIGYLGTNTVKKGENLIGAPTNAVSFSSVKNTCDSEDPLMFVYGVVSCNGVPNYSGKSYCGFSSSGYNYCYCGVSQLTPGKGYNIYSDKECAFR